MNKNDVEIPAFEKTKQNKHTQLAHDTEVDLMCCDEKSVELPIPPQIRMISNVEKEKRMLDQKLRSVGE